MSDFELMTELSSRGFTVIDRKVVCKGCGKEAIWLTDTAALAMGLIGCPSWPNCPPPPRPLMPWPLPSP